MRWYHNLEHLSAGVYSISQKKEWIEQKIGKVNI